MKFFMPTRIYSENDCISRHSAELCALGSHALIVTGKHSSAANGSLDDVISALTEHSVAYTVFDGVEENPSVETVMVARDKGLSAGADFVIGIGGGSPIDAAKAAAIMMKNSDKGWEYLYEEGKCDSLPLAAVPTTCGTGSEATAVSVLTRHDLGTKLSAKKKVFPDIALVDGKYLMNAPARLLKVTAVDALSHLIESAVNVLADTYSDMTVFAGLREWAACRPFLDGSLELTAEGAQRLMNASTLAGMSIAQTGTTIPHSLSYLLTYEAGVPHGAAVGAFQSGYLKYAAPDKREAVLIAAGFRDTEELGSFISSLAPVRAERELLERSAEAVLANKAKMAMCPYLIDERIMADIIDIG
ncbi:MAG: iron-containing alcohol dehydrogenase [Ruminococcus sp.]|nr:iron-containing alcohol dehydrogenase [Ruminococcus sp.]